MMNGSAAPNQPSMPQLGQHDDEAGKDLERDMAGQHVGEQSHAVRDRPRQERQHLDDHDRRQDVDRHALRHEQIQEVQAVAPEAVDDDDEEHEQRQRRGDDQLAGDRERVRDEPDQVGEQDEHEQREHEREEFHPLGAGRAAHRVGDELVGHLRDRLQPARHHRAARGGADQQRRNRSDDDEHEQRRIGEG